MPIPRHTPPIGPPPPGERLMPRDDARLRIDHPFDFGLAIRSRRERLKLRQTDLAARVGMSREWLIGLEHGRSTHEFRKVITVLHALG